jgi:hypothetical protein
MSDLSKLSSVELAKGFKRLEMGDLACLVLHELAMRDKEREEQGASLLAVFASVRTREQSAGQQKTSSYVPCRGSVHEKVENLMVELDWLRAENKRLREKLAEISFAYWDNRDRAYMLRIADEALAGAK